MNYKKIHYFKQSDSDYHRLVVLDAWQIRPVRDFINPSNQFNSVTLKIMGNGFKLFYSDFVSIIQQRIDPVASLLGAPMPIAIRGIYGNTYIIERPPFKTSVRLSGTRAANVKNEASVLCEVWIPWTVSILTMPNDQNSSPSLKMFYNDGPISSFDETLATPWTPNVHAHGDICWGQTIANYTEAVFQKTLNPNNVSEVYHYLVNDYFNGGWNLDLGAGLISYLCRHNIGKFKVNPLADPELSARIKSTKVGIKEILFRTRHSTRVKNEYLTWSLLDLPEVLDAVTKAKNAGNHFRSRTINNIVIDDDKVDISESEAIARFTRSMNLRNNNLQHEATDWQIHVTFDKESILNQINKDNPHESGSNMTSSYASALSENAAMDLIDEHKESFVSFINSSLDSIADQVFAGNKDSQIILTTFQEAIKTKEESVNV